MVIDFIKVGMKLVKYRKLNNFTQDDIALKLFVSRQLVSKWENGTGIPSIDVLLELSKLYHVTFEELLWLNDDIDIDEENIFNGRNRMYVVQSIIKGDLKPNLANVFYQFSPLERSLVLRAIKEGKLNVKIDELYPKLTDSEQAYLRKDDELWFWKK